MKYIFLLVIPVAILFTACKQKKYTCQCSSGWGGDYRVEIKKRNMNDAREKCASLNQHISEDGNYNCYLVDSL